MKNATFFEQGQDVHPFFFQQDGDTDITGDYFSFRDYERIGVLLIKAGTEDVDTGSISFLQATDASGTSAKAVNCRRCWYKTGTMTAQGVWTAVTVGDGTPDDSLAFGATVTAGSTRVVADVNTNALYLLCEILAVDMDVANGFKFLAPFMEGDEVNNACLYSCIGLLTGGVYQQAIPLSPLA